MSLSCLSPSVAFSYLEDKKWNPEHAFKVLPSQHLPSWPATLQLLTLAESLKKADAWKDWRLEEKGATEDEMVGWHHQIDGHGFEQTPGNSKGQGSLASYSPWGCK